MTTTYECIHVPEETFEFVEVDLDGVEVVVVKALCALCGRYYEIERTSQDDR